MRLSWNTCIFCLAVFLFSCQPDLPEEVAVAYEKLPEALDFNVHVKPILSDKCYLCHGPDKASQKAGLQLDIAEAAYNELPESPGKFAIKPGSLKKSEVFHRILAEDEEVVMPPSESNLKLSDYEKAVIIKWIEEGAEYKPHWAFIPAEKQNPPETKFADWAKNPIDQFVGKRLEEESLTPATSAPKEILLRRLSLDLTGLPPSIAEIESFKNDDSPEAYEKQVDRLLASKHYGEKMAADWMDLARFADTHGYSVDRYRDMSPWRDWVIKSFNKNMPYDQFITWQLAGDLLPNATKEQRLATGFNRLHPQNMEGGIVEEEFKVEYVLDRVNTAGTAFMGLTLGCARCHDHKYDPISQKEYFEMSSFFNNVNEAGQISWDNALPVPTMLWPTEKQEKLLALLEKNVKEKEQAKEEIAEEESTAFQRWLEAEKYQQLAQSKNLKGMLALFNFDGNSLSNKINPSQQGKMKRQSSNKELPEFTKGAEKEGLLLNGDTWFDCAKIGMFKRSEPFSVGIEVNIPKSVKDGVIFHRGSGAALYNFKGFHLALKDNRMQLLMAHTAPDNAIIEYAEDIPRDEWVQLTVTYDGSSKADGYKLFVNGEEAFTEVVVDNLYKDIVFYEGTLGGIPGIQIGARYRGQGIGGAKVDDITIFDRMLTPLEVLQLAKSSAFNQITEKTKEQLTKQEIEWLFEYYLHQQSAPYNSALQTLEIARTEQAESLNQVQEVMVMKEMPEPRKTYLLERGQYDAHGEEVFPNTPESVLPMPEALPKNRLGFAQWLTHKEHPLTARVAVNRYWQNLFGRGLVNTTEDFGNQGELPSHRELLDWLAVSFRESGWDVKALMKSMVMSATYRQNSKTSKKLRERDPHNILLARGPTVRLSSEMLRDNALSASGLLNRKIGGKSVKPYQPAGLWVMNSSKYVRDTGDKLYRRSLYTFWKRTVPHPTLSTFDQPERSECTVRRQKTNTPLQALVLLNDPAFVEACRVMGETITKHASPEAGIKNIYTKLTAQELKPQELEVLLKLQKAEYEKFKQHPEKSIGWLNTGEYRVNVSLDQALVAANTVVASTILNSDASITKR